MIKNFNVGPSELFDGVEEYLLEMVKNRTLTIPHRGPDFANMCNNTDTTMRDFFNIPDNYKIFYTYSATEGMEIIIRSIVNKNISHVVNGDFGDLFVGESESLKKEVELIQKNRGERVEIDEIYINSDVLAITANDTSTGIEYSPKELKNIREKFENKFIIVDGTSSFGALNYDINSADAWLFSVQKNFGLPPGLGIIIVNEKVIYKSLEKEKFGDDVGGHHKLSNFVNFQKTNHTPSTPNIMLIGALGFVVNKFKEVFGNIQNLEKHTLDKAKYFYKNISLNPLFEEESGKSKTTFVLKTTKEKNEKIFKKLKEKGYSISPGYGKAKEENIRIASFPVHKNKDLENLIELINNI